MKVIGVVGLPASGKGEFSKIAKELGIPVIVMGDMIRKAVSEAGLEPDDANFGATANRLRAEGGMDASNMLKPALARGEMRTIGATTLNEYQKYIEKDKALERRFQPVYTTEPSVEDTIAILRGLKEKGLLVASGLAHRHAHRHGERSHAHWHVHDPE